MIFYKANPNLELEIITTINNEKEYKQNCKCVGGKYYVKGRDIFYIAEKELWYRKTSDKVDYDHEKNMVYLKDTYRMTKGVVGFDKDKQPIMGLFTPNPCNNCIVRIKGSVYHSLNPEILLENNYFEDLASNEFYDKSSMSESDCKQMSKIRMSKSYTNKGYNIEDNATEFEEKKKSYANYSLKINNDAKVYGKFLGNVSMGVEIETSEGQIPTFIEYRHGIVMCRDGSISGGEAVVVPMKGSKGVQNIITLAGELKKRCNIDINCAFHVHLGNLPRERVYLVALYMLCYQIQDEVFKAFPYYKTDHRGIKRKNYCQKLKQMSIYPLKDQSKEGYEQFVDTVYSRIFEFLSEGHAADAEVNRRNQRHPVEAKWNRSCRYYWWNFLNMLFSKSETAESRIHCPTLSSQRMCNWLFIITAIVRYAENNMQKIIAGKTIVLSDILDFYKTYYSKDENAAFLSEYLKAYMKERTDAFQKDWQREDKVSDWVLKNDKSYQFSFQGKSLFMK